MVAVRVTGTTDARHPYLVDERVRDVDAKFSRDLHGTSDRRLNVDPLALEDFVQLLLQCQLADVEVSVREELADLKKRIMLTMMDFVCACTTIHQQWINCSCETINLTWMYKRLHNHRSRMYTHAHTQPCTVAWSPCAFHR